MDIQEPRHPGAADFHGQTTSDLGALAGQRALENAGLGPLDVDLIVVATATPDRPTPSCASFVQEKLEAWNAAAFDTAAVCSGALFAIATAAQFVRTGMYENVLVIGADTFSNITDWSRRDAVFFGDGAGAVVLSQTPQDKGFLDFVLHTDGRGKEHFTVPAGGSAQPASNQTIHDKQRFFQMNGAEVFRTAVEVVPRGPGALRCCRCWMDVGGRALRVVRPVGIVARTFADRLPVRRYS